MQKRTKIVCTIGPACDKKEILTKMIISGMNVARLNFSHGDYKSHKKIIDNIRKVEKKTEQPITILQDLQGPKIRMGNLPEDGVELEIGDKVQFLTGHRACEGKCLPIVYPRLEKFLKAGDRIMLDDGRVEAEVTKINKLKIDTKIKVGGVLKSNKGINLPDSDLLSIGCLTAKDKEDVEFGIKNNVDMMALSFVTSAKDIIDLRYYIKEVEKKLKLKNQDPIKIIAKIERREAVENIKEILEAVDGIMIARGDLGVEISPADVPLVQKKLIDEALRYAKPVIVATQMLDSMQNNPRPTRAEVSDVANAVIDHADAVMLSNETATGKYPVETVKMMTEIIEKTEKSLFDDMPFREYWQKQHLVDETISGLSRLVAEKIDAKIILAASLSGETGRMISRYRPEFPIVVATATSRVQHQLNLSWGIIPFTLIPCRSIEELVERSIFYLKKKKIVKSGDKIIVVAGEPVGQAGHVNLLEVREV